MCVIISEKLNCNIKLCNLSKWKVRNSDFGVGTSDFGVGTFECGVGTSDFEVGTSDFGVVADYLYFPQECLIDPGLNKNTKMCG